MGCCVCSLCIFGLFLFVVWLGLKFWLKRRNTFPVPDNKKNEECILITGCDSGIGRNTAKRLCDLGYTIFAACLDDKSHEGLLSETSAMKGTIIPLQVNILQEDSVARMGAELQRHLEEKPNRRLFAVVNNAGVITNGPIEMQPMANVEFQVNVNLLGQVRVIQETTKFVRASKGRIVNVVSIAGRSTTGGLGAYCASKHAMEAITDALRIELKPWKISVSAIEPGIIDTSLARSVADNEAIWDKLKPGARDVYSNLYKITSDTGKAGLIGQPVDSVSNAIIDAITSSNPKTRYLVGNDAKLFAFLKWSCSDHLMDVIESFGPTLTRFSYRFKKK